MKVFVIMPFGKGVDEIYTLGIQPAVNKYEKLKLIRGDEILTPGAIPAQIIQAIRDSLFVIAEISMENDNVFYELGYAHALNKKAILISNRERYLPFDVRVNRTIIYNKQEEDYLKKLSNDISKYIGEIYNQSDVLKIYNLEMGQELKGHMHTIHGHLFDLKPYHHLWFFIRREDLETWWPQDNGEVRVRTDGSWRAQLFLGVDDRVEDMDCFYDVKFGFIDTLDNRELTEFCINCLAKKFFPGRRLLPESFEELIDLKVKRIS